MSWRKSSHSMSNGDCVEIDEWRKSSYSSSNGECVKTADWRKSSFSHTDWTGQCVEVTSGVSVRDTKDNGTGPVLRFTDQAWRKFLTDVCLSRYSTPQP